MINEAPKLNQAKREAGGKIVRAVWIEWAKRHPTPKSGWLAPWENLPEEMREVDRQIFEAITAPLRLQVARQAEEMADLWEIYLRCHELAGGKPDDSLHALPVLINRLRRLLIRAKCGCIALDCRHHGSYVPEDVEVWRIIVSGDYPAYQSTRDPNQPTSAERLPVDKVALLRKCKTEIGFLRSCILSGETLSVEEKSHNLKLIEEIQQAVGPEPSTPPEELARG